MPGILHRCTNHPHRWSCATAVQGARHVSARRRAGPATGPRELAPRGPGRGVADRTRAAARGAAEPRLDPASETRGRQSLLFASDWRRVGATRRNVLTTPMEAEMSSVELGSESAAGTPPVQAGELKLEVVVLPVSDVDRAKEFYEGLGWRLDADIAPDDEFRVVQFTPPGSGCS